VYIEKKEQLADTRRKIETDIECNLLRATENTGEATRPTENCHLLAYACRSHRFVMRLLCQIRLEFLASSTRR